MRQNINKPPVPIIVGTKYGTRRQEDAIKYRAYWDARDETERPQREFQKGIDRMRAGSKKIAAELGQLGLAAVEELMQPSHAPTITSETDAGRKTWLKADIGPLGDINDYEAQQGLAMDPNQVDPNSRDNLVPTDQGEMHQSGPSYEVLGSQDVAPDRYYTDKKETGLIK